MRQGEKHAKGMRRVETRVGRACCCGAGRTKPVRAERLPFAPCTAREPRLGEPTAKAAVHRRPAMSIDKEGSGVPEVNVHRRTTKVNFTIVVGVLIFFVAMAGVAAWFFLSNR